MGLGDTWKVFEKSKVIGEGLHMASGRRDYATKMLGGHNEFTIHDLNAMSHMARVGKASLNGRKNMGPKYFWNLHLPQSPHVALF